jgi:hypothetical protein
LGGSLHDILPVTSNVNKLMQTLRNGPIEIKLQTMHKQNDITGAKTFLANDNNYFSAIKYITSNQEFIDFYVPLFPKEKLVALMSENDSICRFVASKSSNIKHFWDMLREIVMANADEKLVKKFRRFVSIADEFIVKETIAGTPDRPYYNKNMNPVGYSHYALMTYNTLEDREKTFLSLKTSVAKDISYDDSKNIIYGLAAITKDMWSSGFLSPKFDDMTGIINHCLQSMKDQSKDTNILDALCAESKDVGSLGLVPSFSSSASEMPSPSESAPADAAAESQPISAREPSESLALGSPV